jgi:hypothetical protein
MNSFIVSFFNTIVVIATIAIITAFFAFVHSILGWTGIIVIVALLLAGGFAR